MPTPAPPAFIQKSVAGLMVATACKVAYELRDLNRQRIALGSSDRHFDLPDQVPDIFKEKPDPLKEAAGLGAGPPNGFWETIASQVGVSPDILKLLFLLLLSTPLSLPFPRMRATLIHVYSILTSVIFLTQVLDLKYGLLQLVGASLVTWVLVKQGRGLEDEGKQQQQGKGTPGGKGKNMPWIVFGLMMAHLTANHARRMLLHIPLHVVEITGAHMVLVMKLTSFAWSAYDGSRPLEELDSYQASQRIVKVPGLLEFFGYVLFFPSLLVGPAFTFAQYRAFANKTLFPSSVHNGGVPPGRFEAAGRNLAAGLVSMAVYALFAGGWSYETILEPAFVQKTAVLKFVHLMMAGFMARTKYYIVWSLSEAAFNVSGAGYDALTHKWEAGKNIDIPKIELAQNYKGVFDNWNIKTNIWLREAIYKRVAKKGKKPGFKSTMLTFATSALWHGPHPAYFFAFIMGGFLQSLGRHFRTSVRPFFLPPGSLGSPSSRSGQPSTFKRLYDLVSVLNVQATLNYIVIPFLLVDVPASLEAYRRLGYYGHLMTFLPLTFFWIGGGGLLKSWLREREAAHVKSASNDVDSYEKRVEKSLGRGSVGVHSIAPLPTPLEEDKELNGKAS